MASMVSFEDGTAARRLVDGLMLAGFVAASSYLGLSGGMFLLNAVVEGFDTSLAFVAHIWSLSLGADLIFAAGSASSAFTAYQIARAYGFLPSAVLSFGMNWFVYGVSFLLLPQTEVGAQGLEAFRFVLAWGFPGLLFASFAPAVVWAVRRAGSR